MFSSVMSSSQTEMCICGDDFQNTCQFNKIQSRPPGGGSASAECWSLPIVSGIRSLFTKLWKEFG